jgi:hypothetical protein
VTTRSDGSATAWTDGEGSGASLRAFTSTAQVPSLASLHEGLDPFAPTGMVPALPAGWAPAPFGLRLAVWVTALLVVAGLALLGIHRVRPTWLRGIEVGASFGTPVAQAAPAPRQHTTKAPRPSGPVQLSQSGSSSATVTVSSAQYTVLVSVAGQRCWVQATTPDSSTPVFSSVLSAGAQQTFSPGRGQLTLDLGASGVTVSVTLPGKHTASWQYTPQGAPFTLNFTSASG